MTSSSQLKSPAMRFMRLSSWQGRQTWRGGRPAAGHTYLEHSLHRLLSKAEAESWWSTCVYVHVCRFRCVNLMLSASRPLPPVAGGQAPVVADLGGRAEAGASGARSSCCGERAPVLTVSGRICRPLHQLSVATVFPKCGGIGVSARDPGFAQPLQNIPAPCMRSAVLVLSRQVRSLCSSRSSPRLLPLVLPCSLLRLGAACSLSVSV